MARTFPSHDWHVQPSCQRPNRFPPERRVFSPEGSYVQLSSLRSTGRVRNPSPHKKLLCPRNLIKLLVLLLACQPIVPTGFPLEIHIWELDRNRLALRDRTADGGCPHASCGSSGTLLLTQQDASSAMRCRRLKRQVRRERFRHGPFKPKQGGRLLVKKRSFWRFLRKPLKPFEDRCPRIEASWPRLISGVSTC